MEILSAAINDIFILTFYIGYICLMPGSQTIFKGRPNISVGQPILVQPKLTQPKHIVKVQPRG